MRWHSQRGEKVVRLQFGKVCGGEGGGCSEMVRQERWEISEVARWEIPCFIQGWGIQAEAKVSSFCF